MLTYGPRTVTIKQIPTDPRCPSEAWGFDGHGTDSPSTHWRGNTSMHGHCSSSAVKRQQQDGDGEGPRWTTKHVLNTLAWDAYLVNPCRSPITQTGFANPGRKSGLARRLLSPSHPRYPPCAYGMPPPGQLWACLPPGLPSRLCHTHAFLFPFSGPAGHLRLLCMAPLPCMSWVVYEEGDDKRLASSCYLLDRPRLRIRHPQTRDPRRSPLRPWPGPATPP